MSAYLTRRLLFVIPTLLLVTIIGFMIVEELKVVLNLHASIPVQYGRWLGVWPQMNGKISGMLEGDLGRSLWTNESINDILKQRIPVSLELGILSFTIMWAFALPIGVFAATRQDSVLDYSGRLFAITMLSMPGFWLATMVIVYPSIWWGTMPSIVYVPLIQDPIGNLSQFILPAFITGI